MMAQSVRIDGQVAGLVCVLATIELLGHIEILSKPDLLEQAVAQIIAVVSDASMAGLDTATEWDEFKSRAIDTIHAALQSYGDARVEEERGACADLVNDWCLSISNCERISSRKKQSPVSYVAGATQADIAPAIRARSQHDRPH